MTFADWSPLYIGLAINVIWLLAVVCLGWLWHARTWLFLPRYWRRLTDQEVVIVVGKHDFPEGYEAAGLVGVGDVLALGEIIAQLRSISFKKYKIVVADSADNDDCQKNLILLGGADMNSVSRSFIEATSKVRKITFGNPDKHEISFNLEGKSYGSALGTNRTDAAAITFTRSPFHAQSFVLLLSGCYGTGTLAAAQMTCWDKAFHRRVWRLNQFESAITCQVRNNWPIVKAIDQVVRI